LAEDSTFWQLSIDLRKFLNWVQEIYTGAHFVRGGGAMKKLDGLVYIGFGLFTMVVWFFPFYWIEDNLDFFPKTEESSVVRALHDIPGVFLQTLPWNFVAVVGLVLIGMGIYRLVRSLFHICGNKEKE
jgi:hypothetical protein